MKTVSAVLLILASSVAPAIAAGPVWDSSGNGLLNGSYYFRQVLYQTDAAGNASGFYCYYGNLVFNGTGTYSITNATFLSYTSQGFQSTPATGNGTYSVSASGYGFLSSPLVQAHSLYFLASKGILIGSETELGSGETSSSNNDLFVAAPIGSLSNSNFQGAYTFSSIFPGGTPADAADATFQLNPNGSGTLGTVSISGFTGSGATINQSSANVTYKFSNNAAVITFPTSNNAPFYSGQLITYFSPDGNFVFGGSQGSFDMFVGVKNATGSGAGLSGLYYEAGLEESSAGGVDSFYGTFNASSGNIVGHQRLLFSAGAPIGLTYYSSYTSGNTYTDPYLPNQYTIGQNGFRIQYGTGGSLGIGVAVPYTPPAATGAVYLDPTGIVNTASSAPYTAGISPGDFLTFYNGVNLASSTVVASAVPFPTSLNNVTVLIDGIAAPIYYVSSTQISVIVPYDVSTFPIASIQVVNNGQKSNIVTTFVNVTTPGVFTSDPVGGIGTAAALDFPASGGYYIVSTAHPAQPGDALAVYVTGLGAPFPSNPAGSVGPATGDSLVQTINVSVGGLDVGTPAYAGLAPGLAGLYQINFTVPSAAKTGNNPLVISGPDSNNDEAYIPIASSNGSLRQSEARPAARVRPARRGN